ncbi:MAG: diguanylate cyclase [Acidobacteriaceae bacterium]|nr:diguanylate cyclase [Acidobacteriaceae bacterium]
MTGESVISVSVGHATYSGVGHHDPNVLLAEADRLMYEAKKRNQASRAVPELEAVAR